MKAREPGYYWVRQPSNRVGPGIWAIAVWSLMFGKWYLTGLEKGFADEDFAEIDERRIVRQA